MDSGGGIDGPQEIVRPVASGQSATVRLRVLGRVQGVGFRPFVVWLAVRVGLAGWIKKTPEGVVIHIEGPDERLGFSRAWSVSSSGRRNSCGHRRGRARGKLCRVLDPAQRVGR